MLKDQILFGGSKSFAVTIWVRNLERTFVVLEWCPTLWKWGVGKETSIRRISLNMSCTLLISAQVSSSTHHGSPMEFAVAYYIPQKEKLSCKLLNRLPRLHPLLNARAGLNCGLTTTKLVAVLLFPLQSPNPEFSGWDHNVALILLVCLLSTL